MCGIIFGANFDKKKDEAINDWIIQQYEDQSSRGQKGFGSVFIQPDGKYSVARACNPVKALMDLYQKENQSPIIMMHHRFPTSSENKMMETHPIVVDNKELEHKYLLVHNGIINNEDELKTQHEKLGYKYTTERKDSYGNKEFNDSESLAIEVSRFIEGKIKEVGAKGSAAFITLQIDKKSNKIVQVFFGKTLTAQLNLSKTRDKIRISSEGEGDSITSGQLYSFNLEDFKLNKKNLAFVKEDFSYINGRRSCANHYGGTHQTTIPGTVTDKDGIEQPSAATGSDTVSLDLFDIDAVFETLEDHEKVKKELVEQIIEGAKTDIEKIMDALTKETATSELASQIDEDDYATKAKDLIEKAISDIQGTMAEIDGQVEDIKEAVKKARHGGSKTFLIKKFEPQDEYGGYYDQYEDDDMPDFHSRNTPLPSEEEMAHNRRGIGFGD